MSCSFIAKYSIYIVNSSLINFFKFDHNHIKLGKYL